MITRKKVVYGLLIVFIALIAVKYGEFIGKYIYFGAKGPSAITNKIKPISDNVSIDDPEKVKDKKHPAYGLSYKFAVIKQKYKNFIYIRYSDFPGKEYGETIKLRISPKTYIWKSVAGKGEIKEVRVKLDKIPENSFIQISDSFYDNGDVKYLWWEPGINKAAGYL